MPTAAIASPIPFALSNIEPKSKDGVGDTVPSKKFHSFVTVHTGGGLHSKKPRIDSTKERTLLIKLAPAPKSCCIGPNIDPRIDLICAIKFPNKVDKKDSITQTPVLINLSRKFFKNLLIRPLRFCSILRNIQETASSARSLLSKISYLRLRYTFPMVLLITTLIPRIVVLLISCINQAIFFERKPAALSTSSFTEFKKS